MNFSRLKNTSTLPVPGNNGNKYEASFGHCSRCSHLSREQMDFRAPVRRRSRLRLEPADFMCRYSRCSHLSREQREQVSKLLAYLFPLFPGTGRSVTHL
jgi:hypothetical protein